MDSQPDTRTGAETAAQQTSPGESVSRPGFAEDYSDTDDRAGPAERNPNRKAASTATDTRPTTRPSTKPTNSGRQPEQSALVNRKEINMPWTLPTMAAIVLALASTMATHATNAADHRDTPEWERYWGHLGKVYRRLKPREIRYGTEVGPSRYIGEIDPPFVTPDPDQVEVVAFVTYGQRAWIINYPVMHRWNKTLPDNVSVQFLPQKNLRQGKIHPRHAAATRSSAEPVPDRTPHGRHVAQSTRTHRADGHRQHLDTREPKVSETLCTQAQARPRAVPGATHPPCGALGGTSRRLARNRPGR